MHAVFLVGVNHKYQFGLGGPIQLVSPQDLSKFADFLRDVIARHGIQGIAEEMSLCALRKRWRDHSFPCGLARELGWPHCYCDADEETQKTLNMTDEHREQYWIQKLIKFDTFPVLFILGADHVETFKGLLIESAFRPIVIARNWESNKPQ